MRLQGLALLALAAGVAAAPRTQRQQHRPSTDNHIQPQLQPQQPSVPAIGAQIPGVARLALAARDVDSDAPVLSSRLFGNRKVYYYKLADGTLVEAARPEHESAIAVDLLSNHGAEHKGSLIDIDLRRRDPEFATTGDLLQKRPDIALAAMPPLPARARRQFIMDGDAVHEEPGHESKNKNKKHPSPKGKPQQKGKNKTPAKQPKKKQQKTRPKQGGGGGFGAKAVSQEPSTPSPTTTISTTASAASDSATVTATSPLADPGATQAPGSVDLNLALKRRGFEAHILSFMRPRHDNEKARVAADNHTGSNHDQSTTTTASATETSPTTTADSAAATDATSDISNGGLFLHGLRQGAIHVSAIFGDSVIPAADSPDPSSVTASASDTATASATATTSDSSAASSATAIPTVAAQHGGGLIDLSLSIHKRVDPADVAAGTPPKVLESATGAASVPFSAKYQVAQAATDVVAATAKPVDATLIPAAPKEVLQNIASSNLKTPGGVPRPDKGAHESILAHITGEPSSSSNSTAVPSAPSTAEPVTNLAHEQKQHFADIAAAVTAENLHKSDNLTPWVKPVVGLVVGQAPRA